MQTNANGHTYGLIAGLLLLGCVTSFGADFHVSPRGKDTNPGTKARPVATLVGARDAIRGLDPSAKAKGVTVWIESGTYVLEQSFDLDTRDSGSKDRPIVYRAAEGATVSVMGGKMLPAASFKPITDKATIARLEPSARGKVLQCNLRELGLRNRA